jgi:hypothetical protein
MNSLNTTTCSRTNGCMRRPKSRYEINDYEKLNYQQTKYEDDPGLA